MAGHFKQNIDHYKLPVDFFTSKLFLDLEDKFGDSFHKFYNKILPEIFSHSYYLDWGNPQERRFAAMNGFKQKKLKEIIETCVEHGFFDKKKYFDYQVLTSRFIQAIWVKECNYRKRKNLIIDIKTSCHTKAELMKAFHNPFTWIESDYELVSPINKTIIKSQEYLAKTDELPLTVGQAVVAKEEPKELTPDPVAVKVVKPVNGAEVNQSTLEIREFIKVPYQERTDEFKKMHPEVWYRSFVNFNERIDKEFPIIRQSINQMQLPEYKIFVGSMKPSKEELDYLFNKMMSSGVPYACDMFFRFKEFLQTYRKNAENFKNKKETLTVNFNK